MRLQATVGVDEAPSKITWGLEAGTWIIGQLHRGAGSVEEHAGSLASKKTPCPPAGGDYE